MKTRLLSIACLLLISRLAVADDAPKLISATDKAALTAAKETTVIIAGKVSKAEWSKSGKVMNIEFENAPHIVGAAFEKNKAKLDEAFGNDLAKALTGATVRISGKITEYGGKAKEYEGTLQFVIMFANQITIIETAPGYTVPTAQP